jgi:hypothetical protein
MFIHNKLTQVNLKIAIGIHRIFPSEEITAFAL